MNENTNRNIFSLDGITGMLIATLLLIGILVGLTMWGLKVQQDNATNPYFLDATKLKMNSVDNAKLFSDAKK